MKIHTIESLLARTDEYGDCNLWTGTTANRVPMVYHQGKMYPVRKLMLELAGIHIHGTFIATSCRTPECICLDHISQRTAQQQMAVMTKNSSKGSSHVIRIAKLTEYKRRMAAKITMEIAREIRASEKTQREIAAQFGIDRSLVGRIRRNQSWRETSSPFGGLFR